MPSVNGLLETALYVADIHKAARFYRDLFAFRVLVETDRLIALDVAGRNVLLLFPQGVTTQPFPTPGGLIPPHGTSGEHHLAFSISAADLDPWQARLASHGVTVESVVAWPQGARSVYFRDPDNHLVELITPGFWDIY